MLKNNKKPSKIAQKPEKNFQNCFKMPKMMTNHQNSWKIVQETSKTAKKRKNIEK